jgi:hypothetical protein
MTRRIAAIVTLLACASVSAGTQTPPTGSGVIAGRVVDASGAPVPATTVALMPGTQPEGPVRGESPDADRVLSDDSGRFAFVNVAAGTFRIEASKPGWLPGATGRRRPGGTSLPFAIADGEHRNDFSVTLWRAAAMGGRVVDDNGDPLIGAEVRALKQVFIAGRRQHDTPIRAQTDDRGIYRFAGLMPGDYLVSVLASVLSEPPGFAGAVRTQQLPASYYRTMTDTGATPMVFDRANGLAGADRPLVGSLSPLVGMPATDGAWPTYPTTYHPNVTSQSSASMVRVQAGDGRPDVDITVRLTPTWTVSGVLRDADGPAAWHAVHLVPAEAGDRPIVDVATAITDPKGAFVLYGVPAGRYVARVIRVPAPSGTSFALTGGTGAIPQVRMFREGDGGDAAAPSESLWFAEATVVVSDRAIRDLGMTMREGARVRGRVRFEGTRAQPTADEWKSAEVSLAPASGRLNTMRWQAPIAADGRFTSASVWPGRYLIAARPPVGWQFKDATYQGRDVSSRPIDLTSDLDNVIVTFTDQVRTIKGAVQVDPGASAEDARVLLFPVDQTLWVDYGRASRLYATARVPASGQFTLPLPVAGDYFIMAIPEDAAGDWQNPEMLGRLMPLAERIHVAGDASLVQPLQVRRIR